MDSFEKKRLPMQFRLRHLAIAALEFPGEDRCEIFVVTHRFAFRRLMFFAEMRAA